MTPQIQITLIALFMQAVTVQAQAQDSETWFKQSDVGCAARLDYFSSSKDLREEQDLLGATAQCRLSSQFSDNMGGTVDGRLTNPNITGNEHVAGVLKEAYLDVKLGRSDVRIGKQVIVWGRADGINPTDNITPSDYIALLPFEDDRRFGAYAFRYDYYTTSNYSLSAVVKPVFESSKIPNFFDGMEIPEDKPSTGISRPELGLRLNREGGKYDWSVSYYKGHRLIPSIAVKMHDGAAGTVLHYDSINVFGFDFASNYNVYGFRGEAAYYATKDSSGTDPSVINPYFSYILGIDRSFANSLNINIQILGQWVTKFIDPNTMTDPTQRMIAVENGRLHNQQTEFNNGFSLRVSDNWFGETLQGELWYVGYIARANGYVRPMLSYLFTDRIKGILGAEIYYGNDETYFGWLKKARNVFCEFRIDL